MVKIIADGRTKTFFEKCQKCATEFEYGLSDVVTSKSGDDEYAISVSTVECPVCGETVGAFLLTKEEHEKTFSHYMPFTNCGTL